ncbi:MAG: DUF1015 domain-containing protein [Planctomycetia bacterium]|nr:MAG: DUF1015 domain-containing protein [Planctomycetia bacterium]
MCTVRPFSAIRYAAPANGDISARLAPPYDVLDQRDKDALLGRDSRNFVAIDLPHVPPKSAGPAAAYAGARSTLEAWLADGTFVRDTTPAIYVYEQRYEIDGRRYSRRKFLARLRLEAFGKGSVFPHEQTFGGPKEDRLLLTQATECNLSPIFGLYEDSSNAVAARLRTAVGSDAPLLSGTLDGVENRIWAVTDRAVIDDVQRAMSDRAVFIADGHHRYGTGLMYREALAAKRGALPEDHPANYVLCAFCAMEDEGLLILPTHRVLPAVALDGAFWSSDPELVSTALRVDTPAAALSALPGHGAQAFAMFSAVDRSYHVLKPRRADLLRGIAPERSAGWHALALAVLHAYAIDRAVTPRACGGKAPEIHYVKNADAAVSEARETRGCVFLMQPNTMAELRAVCQAGDLMPQKSTFFFPKVASGLVIHPLS